MNKIRFIALLLVAGLLPKFAFASGHLNFGYPAWFWFCLFAFFGIIILVSLWANVYAFKEGFLTRKRGGLVAPFIAGMVNGIWLCVMNAGASDSKPLGWNVLLGGLLLMNVVAFVRIVTRKDTQV